MREVKIVDIESIVGVSRDRIYTPFIEAALSMAIGKAVLVDVEGKANLLSCVRQAVSCRKLNDKLRVKNSGKSVYILRKEVA